MNYAAINAKLSAMGSRLLKPHDYEALNNVAPADLRQTIIEAAALICRYITDKTQRSYITAMAAAAFQEGKLHYYTTQWKSLNRLDKSNRSALRHTLGVEIDLNNILWMYRLKRYHRITGDPTYGHLIPIRYKLSHETTRRMAVCTTPKALLEEVALSPYAADFALMSAKDTGQTAWTSLQSASNVTPEQALAQVIDRRYQIAARNFPNSLAPALAYLHRKKLEIQNLIASAEAGDQNW